jgi:hypothetical protein
VEFRIARFRDGRADPVHVHGIDQAMLVGFVLQIVACAVRRVRPNLVMVATTVLLVLSVTLQYLAR